jgi:hypothetical protein
VDYSSETHHAKSLEALGHQVLRFQEPSTSASTLIEQTRDVDLFVWVKTHGWDTPGIEDVLAALRVRNVPIITYHLDLYMGLARWTEYKSDPYLHSLDHFFTVDRLMADWLNNNTPVQGHYLPAGVFGDEAYMTDPTDRHDFANDVIFVGSYHYHPEWQYRPRLLDWLESTYGDRFTRIAGDCLSGTVRGHQLNRLYGSSKVVVGDTLCPHFDYPDYFSDRVFETVGRGGFIIHPKIPGLSRYFTDGEHLMMYDFGDFDQLKQMIDHFLLPSNQEQRNRMRHAGHLLVKNNHTYVHRWTQILETLGVG